MKKVRILPNGPSSKMLINTLLIPPAAPDRSDGITRQEGMHSPPSPEGKFPMASTSPKHEQIPLHLRFQYFGEQFHLSGQGSHTCLKHEHMNE